LRGIKDVITTEDSLRGGAGNDYNLVVDGIGRIIEEDLTGFKLHGDAFYHSSGQVWCHLDVFKTKLFQLLSYLEYGWNLSEQVLEVGSIYNSIADEELKGRCSDILSAPGNFDRVINQATLVLEERIRKKSKLANEIGVQLVNKAINSDIAKSVLKLSDDAEEHEGFGHICRGIVLSFRNPTHHRIVQNYTREDALKFCAFVDSLLKVIDGAK
jgi:hypothetical protein